MWWEKLKSSVFWSWWTFWKGLVLVSTSSAASVTCPKGMGFAVWFPVNLIIPLHSRMLQMSTKPPGPGGRSSRDHHHHHKHRILGSLEASTVNQSYSPPFPCMLQRAQGKGWRNILIPYSINKSGSVSTSSVPQLAYWPPWHFLNVYEKPGTPVAIGQSPRRGGGCVTIGCRRAKAETHPIVSACDGSSNE